jgi:hypothetical protein
MESVSGLSGIKHEAAIEPSSKALHHETVFQFCDHQMRNMGASYIKFQ